MSEDLGDDAPRNDHKCTLKYISRLLASSSSFQLFLPEFHRTYSRVSQLNAPEEYARVTEIIQINRDGDPQLYGFSGLHYDLQGLLNVSFNESFLKRCQPFFLLGCCSDTTAALAQPLAYNIRGPTIEIS